MLTQAERDALGLGPNDVLVGREFVSLPDAPMTPDVTPADARTITDSPFGPVTLAGNALRIGAPVLRESDRTWVRFALLSDVLVEEVGQFRGAAWPTFSAWCIINGIPLR